MPVSSTNASGTGSRPDFSPANRIPIPETMPAVEYRRLAKADAEAMRRHYYRHGYEDLRLRFCGVISERSLETYCRKFDWEGKVVTGAFVDGVLRGVGELAINPTSSGGNPFGGLARVAELALSIERPFQNRGIGSELLRRSLVLARNRFISSVSMTCLAENDRMRALASRYCVDFSQGHGEVEAVARQSWPDALSVFEEISWDSLDLFRAVFPTRPRTGHG